GCDDDPDHEEEEDEGSDVCGGEVIEEDEEEDEVDHEDRVEEAKDDVLNFDHKFVADTPWRRQTEQM
ncbi:hypothetical protein DFQ27_006136, partial [Actinomortierella ambigua]